MSSDSQAARNKHTAEIQILGQRLVLRAEADPRRLEHLAAYVKRKVDELAAHAPPSSTKLALLAAFNIADDYFRTVDELRELKRQVASKSRTLLSALDDADARREPSK
jgi:cell division protein ZapA (FtsZ GTPase activity inhibitor)